MYARVKVPTVVKQWVRVRADVDPAQDPAGASL